MEISFAFLVGHCLCSIALAVSAWFWKINKRWIFLFTFLFFISEPAVFLIWGPYRFYGLYATAFFVFLFLAKATERFYIFLKTQEAVVRFLFWAAVVVFCGAVVLTSISEINLRRDALTFWTYESKRHPDALSMNNLADAYCQGQEDPSSKVLGMIDQRSHGTGCFQKSSLKSQLPQAYLGLGEAFRLLGESSPERSKHTAVFWAFFPTMKKLTLK